LSFEIALAKSAKGLAFYRVRLPARFVVKV